MARGVKDNQDSRAVLSADDRAAALAARVDAARVEVDELSRLWQAASDAAHAARLAADFEAADDHHAEATDLRARLDAATAALNGLEEAQRIVAEERRIEQHTAALADAEARYEAARLRADELFVEVQPLIDAARATIDEAMAAEADAGMVFSEAHSLRVALGLVPNGTRVSFSQPVRDHLMAEPLWRAVRTGRIGDGFGN